MGVLCFEDRKKTVENSPQNNIIIENNNKIEENQNLIQDDDGDQSKLKNIPNSNFIKTQFNYKLNDLSKNKVHENCININKRMIDLMDDLKLNSNADFIIEFENNKKLDNKSLTEQIGDVMNGIFDNNIPDIIKIDYKYLGLDIPETLNDIIKDYTESNKIIGSASLDKQDIFYVITYERDTNLLKPYYYKVKDNQELLKYNSFTAFCSAKGHLYFSGGENENDRTYDPDKTVLKYNDFFYIDLNNLNENKDKLIINMLPNLIESRTWHSMIYIPYKYIFIVGGSNTKSVEIYNMETNEINKDSELNEFRSESTLCLVNNIYLYAFGGFIINQEYNKTIERCNLLKKERKWDYVSFNEKIEFIPSFFGVSYYKGDELLLIGGTDNGEEKHHDYIYKIGNNEEEKDELDNFNCNLSEVNSIFRDKLFNPIDKNKSVNIPLVVGKNIIIYILDMNKGDITIQKFNGLID